MRLRTTGSRLVLGLLGCLSAGDAELPAPALAGCRLARRLRCQGVESLAHKLREYAPELPVCLGADADHLPEGCLKRKYDVAEVVATTYKRLPRFLEKKAFTGQTNWFDLGTKDEFACPLPQGVRPPVIVGGIGDSGTRGVAQLLSDGMGFHMCPGSEGSDGCNRAGDNTVMFKFSGREVLDGSSGRIPVSANESAQPGRSATLAAMCAAINETYTRSRGSGVGGRWGWKSPRSLYYGAYYEQLLRGKFQLVHVLRDGRDVATGDNQMQYSSLCRGLNGTIGKEILCRSSESGTEHHKDAIKFWAQMNLEVHEFGTKVLGPERYFLFRIEDFVLGDKSLELVQRLAKFLNLPADNPSAEALEKAALLGRPHNMSYGGRKLSYKERFALLRGFDGAGVNALRFFGYATDDWGLAGPAPS